MSLIGFAGVERFDLRSLYIVFYLVHRADRVSSVATGKDRRRGSFYEQYFELGIQPARNSDDPCEDHDSCRVGFHGLGLLDLSPGFAWRSFGT